MNALEIPDREVTYRRANVKTQFMTSRFDSQVHRLAIPSESVNFRTLMGRSLLCLQSEDVFAPPPPGKVMFTTSPATLQDLEDGSSTVLGFDPMQAKPKDFGLSAGHAEGGSTKWQVFVPTGEVPDAQEVGYRQVNPMFESCEPPEVIFRSIHKAMRAQDVEFSCSPDWTVCGCATWQLPVG